MRYEKDMVSDLKIAYIGGGSRGWAWGFMSDLAMDGQMHGEVRLYDIDQKAAEINEQVGNKLQQNPKTTGKWSYKAVPTLKQALQGADFVVVSILPGTFEEMRSDVHEPEKYGIYQPVGDTTGPGGMVRAFRTIPMYVEIAEAIKAYSPDAWVINYTNPMALCVRTLYEVFPQVKAFGCCHEVFGTQKLLANMLQDLCGIGGVARQEIKTNVLAINHFTWFDKATYEGMDLFPLYTQFADKYYESGFDDGGDNNWMNSSFAFAHRIKFDLYRRYGLIAAAGDRHLVEFVPGWYTKDPATVKEWKFGLTTVDWRIEQQHERIERSKRLAAGEEELDLAESGEEGHLLMKALLGLGDLTSNVNIPNQGQIPNLPLGAVVETNALFRKNDIAPVMAGPIPGNVQGMVAGHVYNHENTLKAALHCDFKLALSTFLNDPLVHLMPQDGEELLRTMLHNTKDYLPTGWGL